METTLLTAAVKLYSTTNKHNSPFQPLQIKSVIVKEGLRGTIYIEAFKLAHVVSALKGISAVSEAATRRITMVPLGQMVETLRVIKDIPKLKPGTFVRLKRMVYKDDLAQVDAVDVSQDKVCLRLVPRIDYTRMRGALRQRGGDEEKGRLKGKRPPAKLFDYEKIRWGVGLRRG